MSSSGFDRDSRGRPVGDALAYRQAFTAALTGLAIQVALALAAGLTALWANTPAFYAAAWSMLGGLPIWIVIALVYQQHEAERKQRLAAEKLAESGRDSAAIFGNLSDDLDAARARLDRLYRYGLPIVSGFVAIYQLAAGLTLLYANTIGRTTIPGRPAELPRLAAGCDPVSLMFVTAAIAFTAFVSARWASGYARQKAWQLLRGGASYLMSCFVLALLLFGGATAVSIADNSTVFAWLATGIPGVMILVGLEILFTLLLESYRPKVPGEIPRPAFDSRVLGLLTSPESLGRVVADTISYQFGVEVSRSWLYQLLGVALTPLTLLGGAVLLALSCLVIIAPNEQGIVLRWGQASRPPLTSGVHFKLPWPVETVELHPLGSVQELLVTSDMSGVSRNSAAILWTTANDKEALVGQEDFIAAPASASDGGVSLVSGDVIIHYTVGDLDAFVNSTEDPERLLKLIAEREVSNYFASHDIDFLLRDGRSEAGTELEQTLQARYDAARLGVKVVGAAITSLHPPIGQVSRAFHNQINAEQVRETRIQLARKGAVEKLVRATGSADLSRRIDAAIQQLDALRVGGQTDEAIALEQQIGDMIREAQGEAAEKIHRALAYRWQRAVGERSSSEQFSGELLAYQTAPRYYRTRRFLEVLAEGLAKRRKFVITGDPGDAPVFQMDFSDPTSAIDTLLLE
jgi:membrane protease subunit HflK